MNNEWLIGGMVLVVAGLVVVAARLWWKVAQQQVEQKRIAQQQLAQKAQAEQDRILYIYESLNVIARAMLDKQCAFTEGCIRMAVLMDNLSLDCDTKQRFSIIFKVYNATRHIPTHGAWKDLARKDQRAFEREMYALEHEHASEVEQLMAYIKVNPFGVGLGNSMN